MRKKQKIAGATAAKNTEHVSGVNPPEIDPSQLPTCPKCLPKNVQVAWGELVMDAIAAGVAVKQVDARAFVVAAGQEVDLYGLEGMSGNGDLPVEVTLSIIGRKEQIRKSFLASLVAIGGTPLARLRARIAPEEKPKADNDPWQGL